MANTTANVSKRRATHQAVVASATVIDGQRQMSKPAERVWVDSLPSAISFHRDALELELAMGLSFFSMKAEGDKVDLQAKKAMREIYVKAGYDCQDQNGSDYKTVMRRISVAADLYAFIGGKDTLIDWVEDAAPSKHINKIVEQLKTYNFSGITSVLSYIGKPVVPQKRARKEEDEDNTDAELKPEVTPALRAAFDDLKAHMMVAEVVKKAAETKGIPQGRIFSHGAVSVAVPFEATYDDVMAVAQDLMMFAKMQMQLPVEAAVQ